MHTQEQEETKKKKSYNVRDNKKPFEIMMETALNDPMLEELFAYNELKHAYQFIKDFEYIKKGSYFENKHIAVLKWYFCRKHNIQLADSLLMQFIQLEGMKNIINPIKEWITKLKWDGMYRLDSWLHLYAGCELNIYTSKVGRILLCGAIKRIFDPGCKFDYMVILEGEQGTMKSTLFEVLGGDFYVSLSFGKDEKSIIENIQGAWIIELADMGGFRKQEVEWLRGFITRKVDRCRFAYERTSLDYPRQTIFVATTNPSGDNEYLKDDTGNRRFLPILTGKLNILGLRDVRDQLFAEAFHRYKEETLYLTGEAEKIAKEEQAKREENDIWFRPISTYVSSKSITDTGDILINCLHIDIAKASLYDKVRIGKVIKKLGWKKKQNKFGEWEYHAPLAGDSNISDAKPEYTVEVRTGAQVDINWEE